MTRPSWYRVFVVAAALLLACLALVQLHALTSLDEWLLRLVAATRPTAAVDVFNWIFRLGYAPVDVVGAIGLAVWLGRRSRSLAVSLAPLLIFGVLAGEVVLRLVVDQPAPGQSFEIQRVGAGPPITVALDQADAIARQSPAATVTLPGAGPGGRGSFPSGHAGRSLFLALVVLGGPFTTLWRWALITVGAGLVGYSALYFGYHWPSDVVAGYLLAIILYQPVCWLRAGASK